MVRQWRKSGLKAGWSRLTVEALEDRVVPTTVVFELLPDSSPLTLSGTVGQAPITPQGMGALSSRLSGQITTDVNLPALTMSWAQAGTSGTVANSGNWAPMAGGAPGTAPANYGGTVDFLGTAQAAVRGATMTAFTTSPLGLIGADGVYLFSSTQSLALTGGVAAYLHTLLGGGQVNLPTNTMTNMASEGLLLDIGYFDPQAAGLYLLYAPISITLTVNIGGVVDATLNIRGEVIGLGFAADGFNGGGSGADALDPALLNLVTSQPTGGSFVAATAQLEEPAPVFQLDSLAPALDAVSATGAAPSQPQDAVDHVFESALWQFGAAV